MLAARAGGGSPYERLVSPLYARRLATWRSSVADARLLLVRERQPRPGDLGPGANAASACEQLRQRSPPNRCPRDQGDRVYRGDCRRRPGVPMQRFGMSAGASALGFCVQGSSLATARWPLSRLPRRSSIGPVPRHYSVSSDCDGVGPFEPPRRSASIPGPEARSFVSVEPNAPARSGRRLAPAMAHQATIVLARRSVHARPARDRSVAR